MSKKILFVDHYPWPFLKFRRGFLDFLNEKGMPLGLLIWQKKQLENLIPPFTVTLFDSEVEPHGAGFLALFASVKELLKLGQSKQYDAVFVYGLKQGVFRALGTLAFKRRYCLVAGFGRVNRDGKVFRLLLRFFLKVYHKVFVLNRFDQDTLIALGIQCTVLLPSEGLVIESVPCRSAEQYFQSEVRCCFIGRVLKQKGIARLLAQLAFVTEKVSLDIFGPLDISESTDAMHLELGTYSDGPRIAYHGEVGSAYDVLSQYDFLMIPSSYGEGLPMIILESMLSGVIPIFCQQPQLSHVLEHTQLKALPIDWSARHVDELIFYYKCLSKELLSSLLQENYNYVLAHHARSVVHKQIASHLDLI